MRLVLSLTSAAVPAAPQALPCKVRASKAARLSYRRPEPRRRPQQRAQPVAAAAGGGGSGSGKAPPVALTLPDGSSVAMPQAAIVVGSGADAGLQLPASPNLAPAHARLEFKSGRQAFRVSPTYCVVRRAAPSTLMFAPVVPPLHQCNCKPSVSRPAGLLPPRRLFCTALAADPDALLAPTHCWLDGVELRPGVSASACRQQQYETAIGTVGTHCWLWLWRRAAAWGERPVAEVQGPSSSHLRLGNMLAAAAAAAACRPVLPHLPRPLSPAACVLAPRRIR